MKRQHVTLSDVLPPSVKERIKKEGLWNYRISSPLSLDDLASVAVRIYFGKRKEKGHTDMAFLITR